MFRVADRRRRLDALLPCWRDLWHPQPFREIRPAWCADWPALAGELLALSDAEACRLNDDDAAALALVARHLPDVAAVAPLVDVPVRPRCPPVRDDPHWAWEIPGRKRHQIEAFAASIGPGAGPVLDWCGGKGHLGRMLALAWQWPVRSLEIDARLCAAGAELARRAGAAQEFVVADVLTATEWPCAGQHAVALHACGDLHRHLLRHGVARDVARFDVAPCCYYRGVGDVYQPLAGGARLRLTRDDTRLAVTETVTAAPRETRQRDLEIAWKLGFDAWRRTATGIGYRSFKPVPDAWLRGSFADFVAHLAGREGVPPMPAAAAAEFEARGWRRQHDVMRLSIVRHAFRRALEIWLALDLAAFLEESGYAVEFGRFCERRVTPRNLLISAQRA